MSVRILSNGLKWPQLFSKTIRSLTIATHDGWFHCDEALAVWLVKQTDRFRDASILRTRDESSLEKADVVVDVGGRNNSDTLRFDHAVYGFYDDYKKSLRIQMSSGGLVYIHFGREVIASILKDFEIKDEELAAIHDHIYKEYIEALCARALGYPQCVAGRSWKMGNARMTYDDESTLSDRVRRLNVQWNTPSSITSDMQFQKAMELCGNDFTEFVLYVANHWLPAWRYVRHALETLRDVHEGGEIMFLEQHCSWIEIFRDLEPKILTKGQVKYCLYYLDNRREACIIEAVFDGMFRLFSRNRFPKEWARLQGEELERESGIEGSLFVDELDQMGAHRTKEGAIVMALKAIEIHKSRGGYYFG